MKYRIISTSNYAEGDEEINILLQQYPVLKEYHPVREKIVKHYIIGKPHEMVVLIITVEDLESLSRLIEKCYENIVGRPQEDGYPIIEIYDDWRE